MIRVGKCCKPRFSLVPCTLSAACHSITWVFFFRNRTPQIGWFSLWFLFEPPQKGGYPHNKSHPGFTLSAESGMARRGPWSARGRRMAEKDEAARSARREDGHVSVFRSWLQTSPCGGQFNVFNPQLLTKVTMGIATSRTSKVIFLAR